MVTEMMKFTTPFPELKIAKFKRGDFRKLLKPVVYAFAIMGFVFVLLMFGLLQLLGQGASIEIPSVPQNAILTVNFDQKFDENTADSLWGGMDDNTMSFFDLIKYLNVALLDDNVKAVLAQVNTTGLGLAQIQNLQQTIQNFRQHGKKAYIYSSGMGSLGQGTDEYFLASSFDKIFMQPNADLGITGVSLEVPFLNGGLHKLGLDAEFYARHEYKNAAASLTGDHISPEHKTQLKYVGQGIFNQMRDTMAQNRGLSPKTIEKLIDSAPLSAEQALEHKLIDGIAYYSDVEQQLKKEVKGKAISLSDYAANFESRPSKAPTIAYLTIEGTIVDGESTEVDLSGEKTSGADTVVKNIRDIAKNKNVKALLLRINSPGGSYTASNTVWHELERLKQQRKMPIVVSMGDYAASGGYFVALSGDKIFAGPATLTGSIGVLGGKIITENLWKKLNVNWENLNFGANAGILSSNHKFSATEKKAFNRSLDNIYRDFTTKVSAARHIEITALDKIARGRVWLGQEAVSVGLVDEIGTIDNALLAAKELGGIKPAERFEIAVYPKPKTLAEKISTVLRSAPVVAINRLASKNGLDIPGLSMLKQMQYNCMITPFLINK